MEETQKSTHRCEVVPVRLEPHPNADTLSIVRVWGYTTVVKTSEWEGKEAGVYVPPDSIVPGDRPMFSFLGPDPKDWRIRVRRYRGVISQGLLIPAPEGSKIGDNLAEVLGITHYEPPIQMALGGEADSPPPITVPKYDVDSFNRYPDKFVQGEHVVITEKIHGANSRYVCINGRMWAGSHNKWWKEDDKNLWWSALKNTPEITAFCESHLGMVVYAEAYGAVQKLKYGNENRVKLAVLDLFEGGRFLDHEEGRAIGRELPWVPILYSGPFDEKIARDLSNGKSVMPNASHIREGIVIKVAKERFDQEIGRVQLKIVSDEYLEKAK
jgi:RNA ligase (TIGR02306 family)